MSNPMSEYDGLFEVKCTFDPLKVLMKNMSDRQHAMEIEIKVMRESLARKAEAKDLEDTKSAASKVFNNTEQTARKLEEKFSTINKENNEFRSSIAGFQKSTTDKLDSCSRMIKEIEEKLIRTDKQISNSRLDLENYINNQEISKLDYVTKKDEGDSEVSIQNIQILCASQYL